MTENQRISMGYNQKILIHQYFYQNIYFLLLIFLNFIRIKGAKKYSCYIILQMKKVIFLSDKLLFILYLFNKKYINFN